MKKRAMLATALGAVVALGLAGCGGGTGGTTGGGTGTGGGATPAFNAATGKVYNPSEKEGGTLRVANKGDWDSLDPADTYYGYSWNFIRTYTRALTMFKVEPGSGSNEMVGD